MKTNQPIHAPKSLHLIGIDIGANDIHISTPSEDPPNQWTVYKFTFENPVWWQTVTEMLANGCLVAAEPTGWHYMAPIFNLLDQYIPDCRLYLVNHSTTADVRRLHISNSKTDAMDARALAFIAREIEQDRPPRNTRLHQPHLSSHVIDLRLNVNEHARLKKLSNRNISQLRQLAHSAFPALNHNLSTYLNFIAEGAVTPAEIKAFIAQQNQEKTISGNKLRYMRPLAEKIPNIDVPQSLHRNITKLAERQVITETNIAVIEKLIAQQIRHPDLLAVTERWRTIPASGTIAIAALHVATAGQAQTYSPDNLKAVCGVSPQSRESGSIKKTKMSKKGYRSAMNALWNWTMTLLSQTAPPNDVRRYYQQKKQTNQRAFYAARSKMCRIISGVARSPEGYHYQEKS